MQPSVNAMFKLEGTKVGNSTKREKMSLNDRAKIFIPFEPLKGFREALQERELLAIEQAKDIMPFADDEQEDCSQNEAH